MKWSHQQRHCYFGKFDMLYIIGLTFTIDLKIKFDFQPQRDRKEATAEQFFELGTLIGCNLFFSDNCQ